MKISNKQYSNNYIKYTIDHYLKFILKVVYAFLNATEKFRLYYSLKYNTVTRFVNVIQKIY